MTDLEAAQKDALISKLSRALRQADDSLHALAKRYPTAVHEAYGDAEHETDAALAATPESAASENHAILQVVTLLGREKIRADKAERELAEARADTARLDFLQAQGDPRFGWIARQSSTGRGYRLHQDYSALPGNSVRSVIDAQFPQPDPTPCPPQPTSSAASA